MIFSRRMMVSSTTSSTSKALWLAKTGLSTNLFSRRIKETISSRLLLTFITKKRRKSLKTSTMLQSVVSLARAHTLVLMGGLQCVPSRLSSRLRQHVWLTQTLLSTLPSRILITTTRADRSRENDSSRFRTNSRSLSKEICLLSFKADQKSHAHHLMVVKFNLSITPKVELSSKIFHRMIRSSFQRSKESQSRMVSRLRNSKPPSSPKTKRFPARLLKNTNEDTWRSAYLSSRISYFNQLMRKLTTRRFPCYRVQARCLQMARNSSMQIVWVA